MTGLDQQDAETRPCLTAPFRELKAPLIPEPRRNHNPPELFARSMNTRRTTSPWPARPCLSLAPSKAAAARTRKAAKTKRRRVGGHEEESE